MKNAKALIQEAIQDVKNDDEYSAKNKVKLIIREIRVEQNEIAEHTKRLAEYRTQLKEFSFNCLKSEDITG